MERLGWISIFFISTFLLFMSLFPEMLVHSVIGPSNRRATWLVDEGPPFRRYIPLWTNFPFYKLAICLTIYWQWLHCLCQLYSKSFLTLIAMQDAGTSSLKYPPLPTVVLHLQRFFLFFVFLSLPCLNTQWVTLNMDNMHEVLFQPYWELPWHLRSENSSHRIKV